ncbi:hypothetical protein BD410DRAFT_780979 [Rickenella mellea]|uniref:Uncharacterized protein n=1 Tax=Rickenella mellea TaxID=50990 RepID=A0A4Y7QNK1_9AGAM|nr:hypothetical protein BD410DRAFT_780979 [Rickenella mellea]
MIAAASKAVKLYLAPVLAFTATLLSLLAFLAPSVLLHSQVSLISVGPSTEKSAPTILMGALGSCSRPNDKSPFKCTTPSLSPAYDLSALPSNTPHIISSPTSATPVFILISLIFTSTFLFMFTLFSLRSKLGSALSARLDSPFAHRAVAWLGLLGFMIGLTAFLVLRMWFGKSVDDFNVGISELGNAAPAIVASVGNGFKMIYAAYAFLAVPVVLSLSELHTKTGSKSAA